ncbi:hypothetical protein [Pelagibius sp.]|uniref:hypothetical protein n=1 Tax=Pelagibius sp. TaxID=1931238 RepID=UPI003BAE5ACD
MTRKSLPFKARPEADRAAWTAALAEGDIFDGRGPAAHWSVGSRRSIATGYARWLGHLRDTTPEALVLPPAERATRPRLQAYVDHLQASLGSGGVFNDVKQLYDALRVMAPDHDWSWLKTLAWRLHQKVTPKAKQHRIVAATRLLDLGLRLMERADLDSADPHHHQALQYRDGLRIALLTLRPLRRRTLAAITLGETLVPTGDGYALVFGPQHCKNKRPLEFPWPEGILPQLEHYLAAVRPRFPGADKHQGLWASCKRLPMRGSALYKQASKRTAAAFGKPVNLHLFRDIAATDLALRGPDALGTARDLLGHADLRSLDRHYLQARQVEAGRNYHKAMLELRSESPSRPAIRARS